MGIKARSVFVPVVTRAAILLLTLGVAGSQGAFSRVGDSYMQIPGLSGGWLGDNHKNWVRIEARYWGNRNAGGIMGALARPLFSGPSAPRKGPQTLALAIDKRSTALRKLMKLCAEKATIAEITYAEPSETYRPATELGPRPADVPAYFEYKLKNVQLSCPVAEGAREQAIVLNFGDIEWLNYDTSKDVQVRAGFRGTVGGRVPELVPATLRPAQTSGKTKAYVVTWFGYANDVDLPTQCSELNKGAPEEAFYTYKAPAEREKARAQRTASVDSTREASGGQMQFRGPGNLNVCLLPGIVPDPGGHIEPTSKFARGLNLDGDNGTGKAPAGTCKHRNWNASDGRGGIDNQFYRVTGCIRDFQGRKGSIVQAYNAEMQKGTISMLLEISGIDDERNDDNVDVTILFSDDPMKTNAAGDKFLPNYTFRVTDKPEWRRVFQRVRGRIVNGVVESDSMAKLSLNNLAAGIDYNLDQARLRLEFHPDGSLKGQLGGYMDWRYFLYFFGTSGYEVAYGFQCPAVYSAFKREADGMRDPLTGECNGISVAYDIDAVPAFIPPAQHKALLAGVSPQSKSGGK